MEDLASFLANSIKQNLAVRKILEKYVETGNINVLKGCTFSHIVNFLENKPIDNRFSVALMDFGLTKDSIRDKTGVQVAKEWLNSL